MHETTAMAKKKLISDPISFPDLTLIGIASQLKDYRLAHFINQNTALELVRMEDVPVFSEKDNNLIPYPLFIWHEPTQRTNYYLISNNHPAGKLIPAYKQADFILGMRGPYDDELPQTIIQSIKKISAIQLVFLIDPAKIKNLEGIMSDLELHLVGKEPTEQC